MRSIAPSSENFCDERIDFIGSVPVGPGATFLEKGVWADLSNLCYLCWIWDYWASKIHRNPFGKKKSSRSSLLLGHGEMFEVEKQKQCKIIQAPNRSLFASQPFNLEPLVGCNNLIRWQYKHGTIRNIHRFFPTCEITESCGTSCEQASSRSHVFPDRFWQLTLPPFAQPKRE